MRCCNQLSTSDNLRTGMFLTNVSRCAQLQHPSQLPRARNVIRNLRLKAQPRIHMKSETDARKRQVLLDLQKIEMNVIVYRARKLGATELARRQQCLRRLIPDSCHMEVIRICFERDQTLLRFDRQVILDALRPSQPERRPRYWHDSAVSESLLSIPDAIAWAWAKGGDWKRQCAHLDVREVNLTD